MLEQPLPDALARQILGYLDDPAPAQTLRSLNRLIHAYLLKVPWESVSRIMKLQATKVPKDCPRLPEEFWRDAMQHGFGGTCFESSLAFYSLLTWLGFEGYLTVNDMGDSHGCHAAIIVLIEGQKYLVDITIPVHAAVRINPLIIMRRKTSFLDYSVRPVSENKYEVQRTPHPHGYLFTLIDTPVSLQAYLKVMQDDYQDETGRFLKSVVMVKFIDGQTWRFCSTHQPYKLESFDRLGNWEKLISQEALAYTLAGVFQMPEECIATALDVVQKPSPSRLYSLDPVQLVSLVNVERIEKS